MLLQINEKEIPVTKSNTIIANRSVSSFLEVVRSSALEAGNEALFITTLLEMHKKSYALLEELGVENIRYIMEHYAEQVEK